jgi:hypothetical protein
VVPDGYAALNIRSALKALVTVAEEPQITQ